jgi:glycosyltransferase involved in cell wall biosynthesis
LKIAFVGTKGIPARWGGIETYIEQIGRRLVDRGHEVTVFGSRWYCRNWSGRHYRGIRVEGVPSLRLQASDALSNGFFTTLKVIPASYQVVHFHGMASFFYLPVIRAAGKKTVITVHAMESNWENQKYGGLGRRVIKTAFLLGIRRAHCITTVAPHLQDKLLRRYTVRSRLLPAGVPAAVNRRPSIIREKYGLDSENYLLFLGRIDPIKRIEWALSLLDILPGHLQLVVAGGAQDAATFDYWQGLKQRAGLNSRIIFTGPVQGREKEELFSNCLLFLTPSADEGMPLTVLEAAAYGRCSVVSDIAAFESVIVDGHNGFLFARNDPRVFQNIVQQLVGDVARIHRVGDNARHMFAGLFDWDAAAAKAEALYQALLAT